MDVTPLIRKGQQIIQAYAGGVFKVSGRSFHTPILVLPEETQEWRVSGEGFAALSYSDFSPLIARKSEVDVFLLGCGAGMAFLPPDLKREVKAAGLHVEVMDTGAASRTYNVLMAEGRRVAAALLKT